MPLLRAHIVPHPPVIVAEVGQGREQAVPATVAAYRRLAEHFAADRPDMIIFITPHAVLYEDYIHIAAGERAVGSFARFGAPGVRFTADYDKDFIARLCAAAKRQKLPAGILGGEGTDGQLDHGVMVPMYFINQQFAAYKTVRISVSGLSAADHYRFGQCLRTVIDADERRVVIVASGDLSHKLTADGPYGYAPEGPAFDRAVCDAMRAGDLQRFTQMEPSFCAAAAECGLRSFATMAGALDGSAVETQFYGYEGTLGVGYALCTFTPPNLSDGDAYVQLARQALSVYVEKGETYPCPDDLPPDMLTQQAGVFVSIKKEGMLRGCIGTMTATCPHIAAEIIQNAISAGTRDPRFDAITPEELPHLTISVDVLSPPEPIESLDQLDVKRYGVIVTGGFRRGLLLPNLEGVDSVAQQVAIALQKAGIGPHEHYTLARFEVVRHL